MLLFALMTNLFAAEYEHAAKWRKPPSVAYCKNSHVSLDDVKSAIDYWKTKEYDFGELTVREYCTTEPENGLIKVGPADPTVRSDTYGHTHIKWSRYTMDFAVVVISREGSYIYEVVVHEIGHALGIRHTHDVSDIMYEKHVSAYTKMN